MRVLHKVLINLIVVVSFLVIFYVYNTSDSLLSRNSLSEVMAPASDGSKLSGSLVSVGNNSALKEEVNVWCIFTKAAGDARMKYKLLTFSHSLIENANSVTVSFHVIVDTSSQRVAQEILHSVKETLGKALKASRNSSHSHSSLILALKACFPI